jgi:hypothetical protein
MKRFRPRRQTLFLAGLTAGAALVYGLFLFAHERRAAANLETLRRTDPAGYLDQIRKLEGFDAYLALFADHHGFDQARPLAPAFMIGRWTMRDERTRFSALATTECIDPITFEYGRLEIPQDSVNARATYRIDGQTLIVAPATTDPFRVRLISFGSKIDHLELQPPGRDRTYYAYPCSM